MSILPLLLFVLPLGLDTLGVSISLDIKSQRNRIAKQEGKSPGFPIWLNSAILFSLAEMLMPIVGLAIGFSLGTITVSHSGERTANPILLCILIGV